MTFEEIREKDDRYVMHTYARFPVAFVRGKGATLWDTEGKDYIDLTSGIGVNALGHDNPLLTAALEKQMHLFMHVSNLYYTEVCVTAAEKLCRASGMSRVFFANSGAEANEGMIKTARKYSEDRYGAGRNRIITLRDSFHGRTVTTLEATGQDQFHQYFLPFTGAFDYAVPNDLENLKSLVTKDTCAVMLELIQGESGVHVLDPDYVKALAAFCREKDLLLLDDEVQTGVGRTGAFYAYQKFGVTPDIVSSAKALGGGLPVGAVLVDEKCRDVLGPGQHGSTFGANPMSMAAANVVIDTVSRPDFLAAVEEKGKKLTEGILALHSDKIAEVRGMGLMIGVVLRDPPERSSLVGKLLEKGVCVLTAGADVIRLLPPLVITDGEIASALSRMAEVF